ncbi:uncharacterized protein CLUP02_06884 [Colletotrichum lupini]|uniref:Uncharacterized protein n=1 Tax=Colletotrichum lupini TaxID=145971 RepID=A0A9Q8WF48_9PEZI|nr:uncharacterized protein CLUP02_06884 [Colletotrichum lupini]UQC81398.1 hypothetical protein CLUP02_06884 [Colletotrichum lupini]
MSCLVLSCTTCQQQAIGMRCGPSEGRLEPFAPACYFGHQTSHPADVFAFLPLARSDAPTQFSTSTISTSSKHNESAKLTVCDVNLNHDWLPDNILPSLQGATICMSPAGIGNRHDRQCWHFGSRHVDDVSQSFYRIGRVFSVREHPLDWTPLKSPS